MALAPQLEPDEQLLEETRTTHYLSRMLAQNGVLQLTDRRLVFRPTGSLDRALGADSLLIPLASIQDVTCDEGPSLRMTVRTGVRNHLFVGRTLDAIRGRLMNALHASPAADPAGPEEETLATEDVSYFVTRHRLQGGTLLLTKSKLIFAPGGALDVLTGAKDITISLADIEGIHKGGTLDRRTTIATRRESHDFQGFLSDAFSADLERGICRMKEARGTTTAGGAPGPVAPGTVRPRPVQGTSAEKICEECEAHLPREYKFCPHCGSALRPTGG